MQLPMLCLRGGGSTGWGGDFDQKRKFGVKLPHLWANIVVQSAPQELVGQAPLSCRICAWF